MPGRAERGVRPGTGAQTTLAAPGRASIDRMRTTRRVLEEPGGGLDHRRGPGHSGGCRRPPARIVTMDPRPMPPDIDALVQPDRVHRSLYIDPAIFELEMERVWGRAWIFLAHASVAPNPGDYYATTLGRQPVLLVRAADGRLRVLFNRCTHKGTQLTPDGRGQVRALRCAYHGWTFGTDGALLTIPAAEGYAGTAICKGNPDLDLQAVPDWAEYRGFVFARLTREGPDLTTWLGPLADSFDNMIERAPAGELELAGGCLRYLHHCNWKFFIENVCDALHPMVAHQASARAAKVVGMDGLPPGTPVPFALQMLMPFTGSYDFFDSWGMRVSPQGHGDLGGRQSLHSNYDEVPEYWAAMKTAYGEARAKSILDLSRNNSVAWPSLMFKAPIQLLRVVRPLAVDRTLVETWHLRLKGAPDEMLRRTVLYSSVVNSSLGVVGPDDHEAYMRLQAGLATQASPWVNMQRYPAADEPQPDGSRTAPGTSDTVYRNYYRAWRDYMTAGSAR